MSNFKLGVMLDDGSQAAHLSDIKLFMLLDDGCSIFLWQVHWLEKASLAQKNNQNKYKVQYV